MLLKLLKHEFIASYRSYLPVYIGIYGLSILTFFSYQIEADLIAYLLMGLLSMLLGAMGLFTIYNLVISLGTRVYGKPGYLLFSIPAKTSDIMLSKFIANFVWVLVSIFVAVTSLGITFSIMGLYGDMADLFSMLWEDFNFTGMNIFMFITFGVVIVLYYISMFMFLFSLLNLIYKGEKKLLIGVLLYFAISTVVGTIVNMISIPMGVFLLNQSGPVLNFFWYIILVYFVIACVLTGLTYHFMNKKMELQ